MATDLTSLRRVRAALGRERVRLRRTKFTDEEKDAIDRYTNLTEPLGMGFVVNQLLRSKKGLKNVLGDPGVPPATKLSLAKSCVRHMDSAMTKAGTFPNEHVRVVYRGVSAKEVARWKVGSARTFRGFMSTSFVPARAFMYAGCCIVIVRGGHVGTRYIYSPNEDEVILDRGTRLRLTSVQWVDTASLSDEMLKHPAYPKEDVTQLPQVALYEADIIK